MRSGRGAATPCASAGGLREEIVHRPHKGTPADRAPPPVATLHDMTTPPEKPALRLGGMALENGLLVHGPGHWAAAIRDEDGTVRVASGAKTGIGATRPLERVPLVRGVAKMAEMLLVLPNVRRELPGARLPFERPSLVVGERRRGHRHRRRPPRGPPSPAAVEALAGTFALLPALVALRSKNLAAYHGAEHKTIGAYESGGAPRRRRRSTTAAAPTSSAR